MKEEIMKILKTGNCSSLSGRSTLTYKIGCKDDEIFLCLTDNTGQGIFNKDWISLVRLDSLLASVQEPITSGLLRTIFKGKSANSAGFVLAVLLSEKLLKTSQGNLRHYERVDTATFNAVIGSLKESDVTVEATHPLPPKISKKRRREFQ